MNTYRVIVTVESAYPTHVVAGVEDTYAAAVALRDRVVADARGVRGERPVETWTDHGDVVCRWSDGTHRTYRVVEDVVEDAPAAVMPVELRDTDDVAAFIAAAIEGTGVATAGEYDVEKIASKVFAYGVETGQYKQIGGEAEFWAAVESAEGEGQS